MKASETTLQSIIEGAKQYIVPLFQRPYSWERKQWQVLWDDLMELCDVGRPRPHFLGSIVTMQTVSVPEGVPKYLLIDGQQRLTTIFILLCLLRDAARRRDQQELAEEIDKTLLVNPYKKGSDYYKLLPTQYDRESFQTLIRSEGREPQDRIGAAYTFFERQLSRSGLELSSLMKGIAERLTIVSIVLDRDDNPYLVFESLNAKGEPLTQADLIRNFFFLKIHADEQEEMHSAYWRPMQDMLGDRITEFIRHYLMKDGSFVRNDSVYFTLKERLGQGDAMALLRDVVRSAAHYRRLLQPSEEPEPSLSEALSRLGRLEVTTAFPFLLNCYDEYEAGELPPEEFREIVLCIENFIIRRFVCGVPTNQLNKIFAPLYNQIRSGGHARILDGLRSVLATRGYPKDTEFRSRLTDAKLYGHGDRQAKTKLILESIDRSFGHKEPVDYDVLNIEHIMPQTLTDAWQAHLGEGWEGTYELLLHTLGNLTLTGYNPELSNSEFSRKRSLLVHSNLQINKSFEDCQTWREEDIEARAAYLAERAVEVWPYFGADQAEARVDGPASGRPASLTFLGTIYQVESWRDVLEQTLNALWDRDPEGFEEVARNMPKLLGPKPDEFISARRLKNGLHANVHLSAKGINRFCLRVLESTGIDPKDWVVATI